MLVANVPTARKIGIAAQILGRQVSQTRLVGAVLSGLRATASATAHILHVLWLEVTGFVFLGLAAIGGFALAREFTRFQAGEQGIGRLAITAGFCLTFAYFGLSSFLRARRKRQAGR